jgi:hypothetical protein
MVRGIPQELLDSLAVITDEMMPRSSKKRRLSSKTTTAANRLANLFPHQATGDNANIKAIILQLILDTIRDQMDAQHYVGEYATKKFELARDLLPELYKGLKRLEAQLEQANAEQLIALHAALVSANTDLPQQCDSATSVLPELTSAMPERRRYCSTTSCQTNHHASCNSNAKMSE